MVVRQPQQVCGTEQHDELNVLQPDGEQDGEDPKREGTDDPIAERLALLPFREAQDEHGQHHGVVRAEESFEGDEQSDCDEI